MLNNNGLTLIQLIVAISIVTVLSVSVYFWFDPIEKTNKANDAKRRSDVDALAKALENYQIDNHNLPEDFSNLSINLGEKKVLCSQAGQLTCDGQELSCFVVDDTDFLGVYLSSLPIDPEKEAVVDTGYYVSIATTTGAIIFGACDTYEASSPIYRVAKSGSLVQGGGEEGPSSYDNGYGYRKEITIAGSSGGAQTDYAIPIVAHYGSGSDTGINVYLGSNSQIDFDDIRFTQSDGSTELDYYLEQKTDSDKALFWVEVNSIPANPSTATIYIYYGNDSASSGSSGANTFVLWEDFEDGTFIFDTAGSVNITLSTTSLYSPKEGSNVGINSGSQGYKKRLDTAQSLDDGYIVESWIKTLSGGTTNENLGPGVTIYGATGGVNNGYEAINDQRGGVSPQIRRAWDYNSRTNGNYQVSLDTWYFINLYDGGSTIESKLYTEAQMYTQSAQTNTSRSDTTYSSGYPGIGTYNASHSVWDAWRVRKYVSPEPEISSFGSEETP